MKIWKFTYFSLGWFWDYDHSFKFDPMPPPLRMERQAPLCESKLQPSHLCEDEVKEDEVKHER